MQHLGLGKARRDHVHRNATRSDFLRQHTTELLDSGFAAEIATATWHIQLRSNRRDADDVPAFIYVAQRFLQTEKCPFGIECIGTIKVIFSDVRERLEYRIARIGNEN